MKKVLIAQWRITTRITRRVPEDPSITLLKGLLAQEDLAIDDLRKMVASNQPPQSRLDEDDVL